MLGDIIWVYNGISMLSVFKCEPQGQAKLNMYSSVCLKTACDSGAAALHERTWLWLKSIPGEAPPASVTLKL